MAGRSSSEHVVLGTDFSAGSREATARAIRIARERRATLQVVHGTGRIPAALARRFGVDEGRIVRELDAIVAQARASGVKVVNRYLDVPAPKALRSVARELGAELVVVGTRGRTLPDALVGSTAERISALSSVPVLLVRNPARVAYRQVIIAADRDCDVAALARAARVVAPAAALSVVHAYEAPFEGTLRLHGAEARAVSSYRVEARRDAAAALLPAVAAAGLEPDALVLRHGDPRQLLLETSKSALLVMHRGSVLAHVLVGSVVRSVIAHGRSDVLLA